MPLPAAAMVAGKTAGASSHASTALHPKETFMGGNGKIVLILAVSAAVVFIQHVRSGQGQDGEQYIAIGVVGFILLIIGEFAPDVAFALALLFLVAILLNSPNGVPVVAGAASKTPTKKG